MSNNATVLGAFHYKVQPGNFVLQFFKKANIYWTLTHTRYYFYSPNDIKKQKLNQTFFQTDNWTLIKNTNHAMKLKCQATFSFRHKGEHNWHTLYTRICSSSLALVHQTHHSISNLSFYPCLLLEIWITS